jgi:hypothetical protein
MRGLGECNSGKKEQEGKQKGVERFGIQRQQILLTFIYP